MVLLLSVATRLIRRHTFSISAANRAQRSAAQNLPGT
jgi:hypothetical protein